MSYTYTYPDYGQCRVTWRLHLQEIPNYHVLRDVCIGSCSQSVVAIIVTMRRLCLVYSLYVSHCTFRGKKTITHLIWTWPAADMPCASRSVYEHLLLSDVSITQFRLLWNRPWTSWAGARLTSAAATFPVQSIIETQDTMHWSYVVETYRCELSTLSYTEGNSRK